MRRLVLLVCALLLLSAATNVHAATLPVRGSLALLDGTALAAITGEVTFDDSVLTEEFDFVAVDGLTLVASLSGAGGFPLGSETVTEADPRFNDTPQVWYVGGWYRLELDATVPFLGLDYLVLADFAGDGLDVFDPAFNVVAQGTLQVVPIPAALPLFATGVLALGLIARRRSRQAA
ncbi:MAG: hypothetical protein EA405_13815 [Rhodospirillales bacterium]|nr:MAG: hypothetical protein EA405_13815 [Rhodospirillales bacterium]